MLSEKDFITFSGKSGILFLYSKDNTIEIEFQNKPSWNKCNILKSLDWKSINGVMRWFNRKTDESILVGKELIKAESVEEESYRNIEKAIKSNEIFIDLKSHTCDGRLSDTYRDMCSKKNHPFMMHLLKCDKCKKNYYTGKYSIEELKQYYPFIRWRISESIWSMLGNTQGIDESTDILKANQIGMRDILVRKHLFSCTGRGHAVRDIDAVVRVISKVGSIREVCFPASFCLTCNKYFVLEYDYLKIREQGIALCKTMKEEMMNKPTFSEFDFNEEALIHMYGYNVNSSNGITKAQRHALLGMIITEGIMTRTEICNHLDFLIRLNSKKAADYSEAIGKWRDDRQYVVNFL